MYHGAGGATQDFTARDARYKRADNSDADLNNPIPIPSSGINYSYPKHTKIAWTTTPNELIQNLQWYLLEADQAIDPALNWDGLTLWAGLTSTANYLQGTTNDAVALRPNLTDAATYNSATPLVVLAGTVIAAGETGTGMTQPFVVSQLAVLPAALSGLKGRREIYFRFEEI